MVVLGSRSSVVVKHEQEASRPRCSLAVTRKRLDVDATDCA